MKKKIISMIMVIAFVLSSILPVYANSSDYDTHWCNETIDEWVNNKLINGYTDGTFKPNNDITRAEFVKIINKVFGYDEAEGFFSISNLKFNDVSKNDWFYEDVFKSVNGGYINGISSNKFAPNEKITREVAAIILTRVKNLNENSEMINSFSDVKNVSDWAKGSVGACIEAGYLKGNNGKINPKEKITRAEAIAMIDRAMNLTIYKSDTVVENQRFYNLIIDEAVGMGNVTLKNITVAGELLVNGGGSNSIILDSCRISNLKVNKKDDNVRLSISGNTFINSIYAQSGFIIEQEDLSKKLVDSIEIASISNSALPIKIIANIKNIAVNNKANIDISKGIIEKLTISQNACDSIVDVKDNVLILNVVVNSSTNFIGKGEIQNAYINANKVVFDKSPINVSVSDGYENITLNQGSNVGYIHTDGGSQSSSQVNKIKKISISPKNIKAVANDKIQFLLTFEGVGNYSKDVTFEVSNKEHANISDSGLLDINSNAEIGEKLEIKVISVENSEVFGTAIVEIVSEDEKPKQPVNENVEGVEVIGSKYIKLFRGQHQVLKAKVFGEDVSQDIEWEVEDKKSGYIIIDDYSKKEAIIVSQKAAEGSVFKVKAVSKENYNKYDFLEVEVLNDNQISNFELYFGDSYRGDVFTGDIDEDTKEITVKVPKGLNLTKLNAEIYISGLSTVYPGTPGLKSYEYIGDFTEPVIFTVTDVNGKKCIYTVIVEVDDKLKLNPDDEDVVINEFSKLDSKVKYQEYAYGTEEFLFNFPSSIKGTTQLGNKVSVDVMKWKCNIAYDSKPESDTEYIFSPIISKDINTINGIELPKITIVIKEEGSDIVGEAEKVDKVKIIGDTEINVYRGGIAVLEAEVIGKNGFEPSQAINWSIENDAKAKISNQKDYYGELEKIITVNKDAKQGQCIIVKASSAANPEKFAYLNIDVYYDNQISKFALKVKGTNKCYYGEIDEENKTITVNKPANVAYDTLEAEFYTNVRCSVSPGKRTSSYSLKCIDSESDFSKPVVYTITDNDENISQYTLTVTETDTPDKPVIPVGDDDIRFEYFSRELYRGEQRTIGASVVGEESQDINWSVEQGKAEIVDDKDYNGNPVKAIKVFDDAEEGSEIILKATSVSNPDKYSTTSIIVRYDNEIQYFNITDKSSVNFHDAVSASVDNEHNIINIELMESYDLTDLKAEIFTKSDSIVEPGEMKYDGDYIDKTSDFSQPVSYTVTDVNKNKRVFTLSIERVPDILITEFEPLDESKTSIEVDNGTSIISVGYSMPYSISYKVDEDGIITSKTFLSAKWECDEYNPTPTEDTEFTFIFSMPKGYKLADGVTLPEVKVTVKGDSGTNPEDPDGPDDPNPEDPDTETVIEFKELLSTSIEVEYGTEQSSIDFPIIYAKTDKSSDSYNPITGVNWECTGEYNPTPEVETSYEFNISLPSEYIIAEGLEIPVVTVVVKANSGDDPNPEDPDEPNIPIVNNGVDFKFYFSELYREEQREIKASVVGEESQEIIWSVEQGKATVIDDEDYYGNPIKAIIVSDEAKEGSEIILKATSASNPEKYSTTSIRVRYDNEIQYFNITEKSNEKFNDAVSASVDNEKNTINIELMESYDLTDLKAEIFTKSDSAVEPGEKDYSGRFIDETSDFSQSVIYTVTDNRGNQRVFTLSIKVVPDILITEFEPLDESDKSIKVDYGTSKRLVGYELPSSIKCKVDEDGMISSETFWSAKWECDEYNPTPNEDTEFTFKFSLPKGYKLADDITLPEVKVIVKGGSGTNPEDPDDPNPEDPDIETVIEFKELLSTSIEVEYGTEQSSIDFPLYIQVKTNKSSDSYNSITGIKWECTGEYNPTPEVETSYKFTPVLTSKYSIVEGVKIPVVTVVVKANSNDEPDPNPEIECVCASLSVYKYNRNGEYNPYFPEITVKGVDGANVSQEVKFTVVTGSAIQASVKTDYSDPDYKQKPAIIVSSDAEVGSIAIVKATSVVDESKYTTFDVVVLDDNQITSICLVDENDNKYYGLIDEENHEIMVNVNSDANIKSMDIKLYIHKDATVNDKKHYLDYHSEYGVDFTNPVKYIIKSKDGEEREYTVIINVQ